MRIHLEDRRLDFADLASKIPHLFGGLPLLWVGIKHLRGEGVEGRAFAGLEILIAVGVIVTFVKEVRDARSRATGQHGSGSHARVGWFDLAAGIFLLFETFHGVHYKPFYFRAHLYSALIALSMGIFHHPFSHLRRGLRTMEINELGVRYRRGLWTHAAFKWSEVSSLTCEGKRIVISRVDRSPLTLDLDRFANAEAIREAIVAEAIPRLGTNVSFSSIQ